VTTATAQYASSLSLLVQLTDANMGLKWSTEPSYYISVWLNTMGLLIASRVPSVLPLGTNVPAVPQWMQVVLPSPYCCTDSVDAVPHVCATHTCTCGWTENVEVRPLSAAEK
jgi:hypothetical protein